MVKNLLLASVRSIARSKYYTFINVVGLGVGISCFVIISTYVAFEESFDSFHGAGSSIYRVTSQKNQNGEIQNTRAQAPVILRDVLLENVPEVETAIRIHPLDAKKVTLRRDLQNGERIDVIENKVYHSESAFFSLFNFELLSGNEDHLLDDPYTVVLSESVSKKLFGDENPVGKSLRIIEDFDQVYEVTGVMKDLPSNTHFEFNLLISFESFRAQHPNWRWTAWDWDYFYTYIKARPDVEREELLSKIQTVADRIGKPQYEERSYTMNFELQPVQEIYLTSQLEGEFKVNGEGRYLNYLYGIAIAILVLAWINFMNLSVVRVMDKAREVGVRATFGASKLHLAIQALVEVAILNLSAIALAVVVVTLASNPIASLLNIHLPSPPIDSLPFWLLIGLIWIGSIMITSIYPLFILLRFQPKKVLKGKVEHSMKGARLWKGLVIFQYSVSILLIVLTMVVQKQLKFLQDRDLGISLSQVLTVYAPAAKEEGYWNQVDLLRNQLKDSPSVSEITGHSYLPGESLRHVELFQLAGRDINEAVIMKYQPIDLEYFQLFDIPLLAGQDFMPGVSTRTNGLVGDVILNEAAVLALGINSPDAAINRDIVLRHSFGALSNIKIRAVVKDYNQLALAESNFPMAFILGRDTHWSRDSEFLSFKLSTDDIEASVEIVRAAYKNAFPEDSFQYFFADDSYNQAYQSHTKFGKLVGLFCVISIVLAVFGLIGVSTHTVRKRLREIAIRKVHGASVLRIVNILLGSVMMLVVLGFVIAIPLCYFLSDLWLQNFAERISLSVWMFVIPLVSIVVISVGTVLHHSLKAALINPINIIRDE